MASLSISSTLPAIKNKDLEFVKYANLLAVLMSRAARWDYVPGKPLEITVDATTVCNLKCPYCSTGNGTLDRPASVLKRELHSHILDFCGSETFICWYFSNGEPLLNKRLPEIMAMAAEREIFSVISTNLSVPLGKKKLEDIAKSGLNFVISSIDGACEETYGKYRVGGDFKLVLENLKNLVEIKKDLGREFPIIEWRCLLFEHNQHELADVLSMAGEVGVDLVEFFYGSAPPDAPEGRVRLSTLKPLPLPAVSGPFLSRALQRTDTLLRKRLFGKVDVRPELMPDSQQGKCDWLYLSGMYYPDGDVGPCCVVGDTKTDFGSISSGGTYGEIWNGATYRAARNVFKGLESPGIQTACHHCPLPAAQNDMFRNTLQAYLLNAPAWFLGIVSADPKAYFHPYDFVLLPREINEICALSGPEIQVPAGIAARLEQYFAQRPRVLKSVMDCVSTRNAVDRIARTA